MRALRDMGAVRVRVGDVDILFAAPDIPEREAGNAELEQARRERDRELDEMWSA